MIRLVNPELLYEKHTTPTLSEEYITDLFRCIDEGIVYEGADRWECTYAILVGQNMQLSFWGRHRVYSFGLRQHRIPLWRNFQ